MADQKKAAKTGTEKTPSLAQLIADQDPAKLQTLSMTMTEAMRESHALIMDIMNSGALPAEAGKPDPLFVGQSFARLGQSLAGNPAGLMAANMKLWQGLMEIWSDVSMGAVKPGKKDRRFSDTEWTENPVYNALKRTYELNTEWMMSLVASADGLDDAEKEKAKFYIRQTIDAFAPTNFFATNPAALRALISSGGDSVLRGLRHARQDYRKGGGKLTISQSDETPFKLGENIATADGQVVFRNDLIEVLQYTPSTEKVHDRPLLIYTPWINKFYILDLREENSMIRWLVSQGFSVFVVSWRSADETTKDFDWDDYVQQGGYAAVAATLKASGAKKLNAVGYCIGGTMLSGLLAHMARNGDDRIASATFFASQADFKKAGDLLVLTDKATIDHVEGVIEDNGGLMPGEVMRDTFNWLRPVDLVWRYVVDNYMLGKSPRPFDLLYWNADQTNIPGPTHLTYLRNLYHQNDLAEGRFKVLGDTVNLGDVNIPIMVQASRDDHICPYDSVYRAATLYGGKTTFLLAGSGHIAGVVNHPDAKKYQHWISDELPTTAGEWLDSAKETPGSWWPYWAKWLKRRSGKLVEARKPKASKKLGKAPGTYAQKRLEDIAEERTAC